MKIRCTYSELVKASTPDWGTSLGCEKLKVMLREIYDAPCPWQKQGPRSDMDARKPEGTPQLVSSLEG